MTMEITKLCASTVAVFALFHNLLWEQLQNQKESGSMR